MVWLGFGINGDTLVRNISNIAIVVISSVCYCLNSAIRKMYLVRSSHSLSISSFSSLEICPRVIISYSVFKSVWLWGLIIYRRFPVCWSRVKKGRMIWG